jgi:phage terminase large subunit
VKEVEICDDIYLDCFHHLLDLNDDIDIELIFGGRDSGKSKFLAQLFTTACMELDYFRALLIKQTFESIKDTQWQLIKDNAEQWQVDHLFKFFTSPLSIRCDNGNSFHCRGMDNPANIRSFANPSHAWIEEATQISEDGFINVLTGLRSDYGRVKLYFTFNPEADTPDFTDFWLYKMFYKNHEPDVNFVGSIKLKFINNFGHEQEVSLKYRSTHVTYHQNPFVSPQRIAFHESLKENNPYWYRVFTLGLWGNILNDSPWAFAFNKAKHVSDGAMIKHPVYDRSHELYLSWDFNRNPMTCLVIQHYNSTVKVLESIRVPRTGIDGVTDVIKVKYPYALYIITGDYNGNNTSSLFAEHVTHYKLIKHFLKLADSQFKVKPNPLQAKNSTHINNVLSYYNVIIHGTDAASLVFDLENVRRRANGTIMKTDRDNPAQQADSLDCFRYFCNAFLDWFQPMPAPPPKTSVTYVSPVADENKPLLESDLNGLVQFNNYHASDIEAGRQVVCTQEDYQGFMRNELIKKVNGWIAVSDYIRARFAIEEIKRLDGLFIPSTLDVA